MLNIHLNTRRSQHSQECKDPLQYVFCLVKLIYDLLIPKLMDFQEPSWNILYVKFGDPSCVSFWDIVRIIRQTDKNANENPTPVTSVGIGNKTRCILNCTTSCFLKPRPHQQEATLSNATKSNVASAKLNVKSTLLSFFGNNVEATFDFVAVSGIQPIVGVWTGLCPQWGSGAKPPVRCGTIDIPFYFLNCLQGPELWTLFELVLDLDCGDVVVSVMKLKELFCHCQWFWVNN